MALSFGSASDDGDEFAETIDDVDEEVRERPLPSLDEPDELKHYEQVEKRKVEITTFKVQLSQFYF